MKKIIYAIIDFILLGRGILINISGFKLRIPVRYHKYFESNYELNNINFINNYVKEGHIVIDIGAHIGLLTTILAKKTGENGRVYSFEPTPGTYALLEKTIKINHIENIVSPVKAAISDSVKKTVFFITDIEGHNSNSLVNNKRVDGKETGIEVALFSLDYFAEQNKLKHLDFIKIDAEGAELKVLKGANEIMESYTPLIILALHPSSIKNFGDSLSDIWEFIVSKNYQVFLNNTEIDKSFFISQVNLFDVFLIPKKN